MIFPPMGPCDVRAQRQEDVSGSLGGEKEDATHDELVRSFQSGSKSVSSDKGVFEEVAETSEKLIQSRTRLDEVDEEIVRSREEDVVGIGNDQFSWVVGSRLRR